jgi:hypothetical protein
MMTPQQHFAERIAERVQYAEVRNQRALGADWVTAYTEAWRIMDEVYDLVLAPDRPVAFLGLRMISNRTESPDDAKA